MTGSYRIAEQRESTGYYASVTLEIETRPGEQGLTVAFADELTSWRAGAEFGIHYAHERAGRALDRNQAVIVRVVELFGNPVDTTEIVVAYAAAHAFWNAIDVSPLRPPELDLERGVFLFPK